MSNDAKVKLTRQQRRQLKRQAEKLSNANAPKPNLELSEDMKRVYEYLWDNAIQIGNHRYITVDGVEYELTHSPS